MNVLLDCMAAGAGFTLGIIIIAIPVAIVIDWLDAR